MKPAYVTFEQAKLLKVKGFDVPVLAMYHNEELIYGGADYNHNSTEEQKLWNYLKLSAPEQWQVVEWLRVKHGIWISIQLDEYKVDKMYYEYTINTINVEERFGFEHNRRLLNFISPQEAYSSAFDYVLKELI